jgi:hypothetical protein
MMPRLSVFIKKNGAAGQFGNEHHIVLAVLLGAFDRREKGIEI